MKTKFKLKPRKYNKKEKEQILIKTGWDYIPKPKGSTGGEL